MGKVERYRCGAGDGMYESIEGEYVPYEDYRKLLEKYNQALSQHDVSFECTHDNTEFKHIRCNVCTDCCELVEIDV